MLHFGTWIRVHWTEREKEKEREFFSRIRPMFGKKENCELTKKTKINGSC